jgi:hypothetical protein
MKRPLILLAAICVVSMSLPASAMPIARLAAPGVTESGVVRVHYGHHYGWYHGRGHHYGWYHGRGHHYGWWRGRHHGWS